MYVSTPQSGLAGYTPGRYVRLFYPPPYQGMAGGCGCAPGSECGCCNKGVGQAETSPDQLDSIKQFFYEQGQQNTDLLGSINARLTDLISSGSDLPFTNWLLVGLAGLGLWWVIRSSARGVSSARRVVRRHRSRRAKLRRLKEGMRAA